MDAVRHTANKQAMVKERSSVLAANNVVQETAMPWLPKGKAIAS
jgi:hypothetical protein